LSRQVQAKITNAKRAGGRNQVVKCLPIKHEALSSTTKKKKEEEAKQEYDWSGSGLIPSFT
jgi:hypothetical protein